MEDHKSYQAKHAESAQWLEKAKRKFAVCSEAGGSRAELEDRLEKVQVRIEKQKFQDIRCYCGRY